MPSHSLDSSFARGTEQERFSICFRSKPITLHHTVFLQIDFHSSVALLFEGVSEWRQY